MTKPRVIALTVLACFGCVLFWSYRNTTSNYAERWCTRPNTETGEQHIWKVRGCKNCQSVQGIEALNPPIVTSISLEKVVGRKWRWHYKGEGWSQCDHDWGGVSSAVKPPVKSGQVVLVRKGGVYGAFILTSQTMNPETAYYLWRYGTDKNGAFSTDDSNVTFSDEPMEIQRRHGSYMIEFGPFEIEWSGTSGGKGFLYYPKSAIQKLSKNDVGICVTDLTSLDDVRPRDRKWHYKSNAVE